MHGYSRHEGVRTIVLAAALLQSGAGYIAAGLDEKGDVFGGVFHDAAEAAAQWPEAAEEAGYVPLATALEAAEGRDAEVLRALAEEGAAWLPFDWRDRLAAGHLLAARTDEVAEAAVGYASAGWRRWAGDVDDAGTTLAAHAAGTGGPGAALLARFLEKELSGVLADVTKECFVEAAERWFHELAPKWTKEGACRMEGTDFVYLQADRGAMRTYLEGVRRYYDGRPNDFKKFPWRREPFESLAAERGGHLALDRRFFEDFLDGKGVKMVF